MLPTAIKLHDHSANNLSDQENSRLMDDLMNDLETGIPYNTPRHVNKKMKKRKQLDALLKSRSSKSSRSNHRLSHEALLTSEDELFLPDQKNSPVKLHPSRYRRWWSYTRHILSFCLVCIFMIVCVGLAYANIELKNEVQNLSSRVTEIEKRFSNFDINRIISTIEQIKTRLSVVERWNVSYIYDRLQKLQKDFQHIRRNTSSTEMSMNNEEVDVASKLDTIEQKSAELSDVTNELDKLSRDADDQATNMINEKTKSLDRHLIEDLLEQERRANVHQDTYHLSKIILSLNESLYKSTTKWHNDIKSLRKELESLNQSTKIQELVEHFQGLTNIMHNSSDKTSAIITTLQSDLNKLRIQIEACKCPTEPVHLKPSIVDSNQLQQSIITKPSIVDKQPSPSTTIKAIVTKELKQSEQADHDNTTIDIAQVVNQPSTITD